MNNKVKLLIGIIAIISLILIIINIVKNNLNDEVVEIKESNNLSDIKYDEDTGEYYILDKETGEILYTGASEDELYIYTIDPDYDPKIPTSDLENSYNEVIDE